MAVTDSNGVTTSSVHNFHCVPPGDENNHGFVRTNGSNYLLHDDDTPYVPIGENMSWQNTNAFLDYQNWLDKLSDHGGNYFRLWHAHWGLGIEWKNGWNNFQGLRHYQQENSRYQDWLFDYCVEKGIYVMLCLQHHGQVSTQVNPNWSDNPYNAANQGPCQDTWDFFTDSTAKAHTKNRLRYIVARWGYARSIMAWELWNEVDWTDNYDQHANAIKDWHEEMASFLKIVDPYRHLISTSFAREENHPTVWANPDLELSQTHHYVNSPNIEQVLANSSRSYLEEFGKPTLNGEFGIGFGNNPTILNTLDPDGIHIHNGLWGGLFGGGMGSAMSWWWDIYIDPQDLYYHFEGISAVSQVIPFMDKDMSPKKGIVQGAPGSLLLSPDLDWGNLGQDTIVVNGDGSLSPSDPDLSIYLYGSQWNTQFRSPPTFVVNYPQSGTFVVNTSSTTGQSPKIAIWVDGTKELEQNAQTDQSYTVSISPGPHTITVDNTGTDWITISTYEFSELGTAVDAYLLTAEDESVAAGWVLNNRFNHQIVPDQGNPPIATHAEIQIEGFSDGTYYAKWYNCLSGEIFLNETVIAENDTLTIPVPELMWDAAFLVDDQVVNVAIDPPVLQEAISLYPNPTSAGSQLFIHSEERIEENTEISLLDASGRIIGPLILEERGERRCVRLPERLPVAMYWLRIHQAESTAVLPLMIR